MKRRKRLFDLAVASTGLVLGAPLLAAAAAAVWAEDGGPVLFRQQRMGHRERPFRILKFRTMSQDAEATGRQFTVGADPRITRVGALLRATKLDELPQLVNVLKGEMTLVGPRPESLANFERYKGEDRALADVVPGITDPSSLAFRWESDLLDQVEDPDRFYWEVVVPGKVRLSLEYADQATLRSDLKILLQTLGAVLGDGAPPDPETVRATYSPQASADAAKVKGEPPQGA